MKKVTQSGALPTAGSNRIDLYSQSVGAHSSTFVSAGRGPILKRRVDPSLPVADATPWQIFGGCTSPEPRRGFLPRVSPALLSE